MRSITVQYSKESLVKWRNGWLASKPLFVGNSSDLVVYSLLALPGISRSSALANRRNKPEWTANVSAKSKS